MCNVMCLLSVAHNEVLSSRVLNPRVVLDLSALAPLPSACLQPIDDIGSLSIAKGSSFDQVLSYIVYHRNGEVDWSVVNLWDTFMFV